MDTPYHLNDDELKLALSKRRDKNRLGFAVMLKYFEFEGHYPQHAKFIDPLLLNNIANQLNIDASCISGFDWGGRSTERFRGEINEFLGYQNATAQHAEELKGWLISHVFPLVTKQTDYIEHAYEYFRGKKIAPFSSSTLERHISSAHFNFEKDLFESVYNALSDDSIRDMDELLSEASRIKFKYIKKDIAGPRLKYVEFEIEKMAYLRKISLPNNLIGSLSSKLVDKYYLRILAEPPNSIKMHNPIIQYATFAMFCYRRSEIIIDNTIDVMNTLIHKLQTKAESYIDKQIMKDIKCVNGKFDILHTLANAAVMHPSGIIQKVIYPHVDKSILSDLVKELEHKGQWYNTQVRTKMQSLYSHAHRKTLLNLVEAFTFKTDILSGKSVLSALEIIKSHRYSAEKYYPADITVPLNGVVPTEWLSMVTTCDEEHAGFTKIHRMYYEMAVLQTLSKHLTCKMIWVEGAHRYRDPNKDLPQDFDENREYYYAQLGLPLRASEFIAPRMKLLHDSLLALNKDIISNEKVSIISKDGGRIKITPSEPQVEPKNIKRLHQTIQQEWSTINLIDILKEADLQIGFTKHFHTVASRETISKDILQYRLLLCLYAIGTNAGMKCISSANSDVTYSDLRYVKRRFINTPNVKEAIISVINRILEIRDPRIWGEATTGVARDSRKLSVWDQNLMAEWHARYKGRGVMVYWHVEKKALCIHSQLKTCSSSEVGAMLKGILQHCTDMTVDQAYMDTHGQSTLGFGVSEFLSFQLLPRLKAINKQKLFYPLNSQKSVYGNLQDILKGPINWRLVEENYDEVIKHIVALKLGIIEPDVFIKKFSKDNFQHPVYRALVEMGKVSKTIFLCRYLMSEELRIEINEAQNVVERLNSIMGFIFYGKLGEISTNVKDDQELAIACLHLIQACMAYINTLIIQNVLSRPEWEDVLMEEDKRALNVLIHSHINPYGLFPLDMFERLGIQDDYARQAINNQYVTDEEEILT